MVLRAITGFSYKANALFILPVVRQEGLFAREVVAALFD